jgi:hypothetical protein
MQNQAVKVHTDDLFLLDDERDLDLEGMKGMAEARPQT